LQAEQIALQAEDVRQTLEQAAEIPRGFARPYAVWSDLEASLAGADCWDIGAGAEEGGAGGEAADTDPGSAARDAGVPCVERFGTSLVTVATARVDGVAVTVGLFADGPARSYTALDQVSCEPVASGDL
jgi:hypothetical protein